MKNSTKIILYIAITLFSILSDQVTKEWARQTLQGLPRTEYWGGFFSLEYIENTGAFLSLGDSLQGFAGTLVFILLPIVALTGLCWYAIRNMNEMNLMQFLSFACIFSGGIGNIIDRILFDRHVTDFMNMGIGGLRTGIFNVADIFVTAGVIMLVLSIFLDRRPKKTEGETRPESEVKS